jgi:hypothetical protein
LVLDWLQNLTADEFRFRERIDILLNFSLIEENENSETCSIPYGGESRLSQA